MPFPIRSFGTKLLRLARHADLQFARHLREQMLGTEDRLKGVAERVIEDLYQPFPRRPIDPVRRRSRQRMYASWFRTPIIDLYENLARRGSKQMDNGYLLGARQFRALITRLYPKRYVPRLSEGWAMDGEITLLEGIEGLSEDDVVRLMAADAIQFSFGTGEIRQGLKDFVDKQLQRGVEPGSLIRTMTSEHVGKIRESVGEMLDQAQSLGWAKNEALRKITGRVANPAVRTALEHNVMRIVRTAHMQGINQDMLRFGSANRDVVAYLVRQADGRPCVACALSDGQRYPVGAELFDEHMNGMCCRSTTYVLTRGEGHNSRCKRKLIPDVGVGDMVYTHKGNIRRVTAVSERDYSGELVSILIRGDSSLQVTPKHPVFVRRDGEEVWIPAGDLLMTDEIAVRKKQMGSEKRGAAFPKGTRTAWNKGLKAKSDLRVARNAEGFQRLAKERRKIRAGRKAVITRRERGSYGAKSSTNHTVNFRRVLAPLIKRRDGQVCQECGGAKGLQVHHINEVILDDDPMNLITLCSACHNRAHLGLENDKWEERLSSLMGKRFPEFSGLLGDMAVELTKMMVEDCDAV